MRSIGTLCLLLVVTTLLGGATTHSRAPRAELPAGQLKLISEFSESLMTVEGKCFRYAITDDTVAETPAWDPEHQLPPLELTDAISLSRDALQEVLGESPDFMLSSIELDRSDLADRWYYVISWRPRYAGYRGDSLAIPVLMDGQVIRPERRKCHGDVEEEEVH